MDSLRLAAWFGRERVNGYAKVMLVAFAPSLVYFYFQAMGPTGSDFLAFWSAAKLALTASPAAAYDTAQQVALQSSLGRDTWVPFVYPPPFLALVLPFGLADYAIALPLWVAATYAVWLAVAARIAPGAFWPVAAYPAALVAAWHARTGFVTGALFVAAILALRSRRPILAGALFGALIVKPHLALLVPVALLASREYRAFVAAGITACGLLLLSWAVFGTGAIEGFLAARGLTDVLLAADNGNYLLRQATVRAAVILVAGPTVAAVAQGISSLLMAMIVWRVWARSQDALAKGAVLAIATVLATPYLFNCDLPLLILPTVWLGVTASQSTFRPWEKVALVGFYWLPLAARAVALPLGVNLTAPLLAVFLWFVLRRISLDDAPFKHPAAGATADL